MISSYLFFCSSLDSRRVLLLPYKEDGEKNAWAFRYPPNEDYEEYLSRNYLDTSVSHVSHEFLEPQCLTV